MTGPQFILPEFATAGGSGMCNASIVKSPKRGEKVSLLKQYGRHPGLRLRTGGGHPHSLGRGEGFPGVRQGHLQGGRQHRF